ncbi:MAG: Holliday junction branch migration protein RuvA [Treponema sp.]|nr:Holliday junction branch migration protein RuvA [Treponema sp.]
MFNSLTGTITGKFPRQLLLETNGIEWSICMPDSSLDEMPEVGSKGKVYTFLNHYENGMDLYGFASDSERNLFLSLLKVDGVGPKAAIKIMSSATSSKLIQILDQGDLALLEKIPGVGKKTAAKMILALKGKLTLPETESIRVVKSSPYSVVINSLCEMGYDRQKAEEVVSDISSQMQMDQEFINKSQTEKEDVVFRKALMEMVK